MAKKKVTTVTEEIEDTQEVKYDEIHNKDMSELVADAAKETTKEKKTPDPASGDGDTRTKAEEEHSEEKKEVTTDQKGEKDEGVDFDPEKFKAEAAEEVTKRIVTALQGESKKETTENVNAYQQLVKETQEKYHRNPTWDEVLPLIEEQSIKRLEERQKQAAEEAKKLEEEQKAHEEARIKQVNEYMDRDLNDLYAEKKLPRIVNKDDPKDPGVVARKALFQTMLEVNQKLIAEGKEPEYSVYKIYHRHYKAPTSQPAGADAPVSAGSNAASESDDGQINYFRDIRKASWRDILRGK